MFCRCLRPARENITWLIYVFQKVQRAGTWQQPPPLPTLFKEFTNLVSLHVNFLFGITLLTPPPPPPFHSSMMLWEVSWRSMWKQHSMYEHLYTFRSIYTLNLDLSKSVPRMIRIPHLILGKQEQLLLFTIDWLIDCLVFYAVLTIFQT